MYFALVSVRYCPNLASIAHNEMRLIARLHTYMCVCSIYIVASSPGHTHFSMFARRKGEGLRCDVMHVMPGIEAKVEAI